MEYKLSLNIVITILSQQSLDNNTFDNVFCLHLVFTKIKDISKFGKETTDYEAMYTGVMD